MMCIDVCPKNIIVSGEEANKAGYIYVKQQNGETCIGCAMCATMCPDCAIEVYADKPA
jgi:2-oxoglutarate ferredoxin oxidoreductase subunit delta